MRHLPVAIFLATSRPPRSPRRLWLAIFAALAVVLAIAVPAGEAAVKPPVAYFKVSFSATQDLTWKEDTVAPACGGNASVGVKGSGRSRIRVRTRAAQPAKASWLGTKYRAVYFPLNLPVSGTYFRTGKLQRWLAGGKDCSRREWEPKPARDCGTRRYPRKAVVNAEWVTPDSHPAGGLAPLVPSIYISGPWVPGWSNGSWVPFRNCPGRDLNGEMGITEPNEPGTDTGLAPLTIRDLFHGPRRMTLRGAVDARVDLVRGPLREFFLSGEIPVTVKIRWTMRLTRVDRPPAGL